MDQNSQQTSNPPVMVNNVVTHNTKKVGPIVATLVVVLLLVITAIYFFASKLNSTPTNSEPAGSNSTANIEVNVPAVTNTSDDPQSLADDLNSATQGVDSQDF